MAQHSKSGAALLDNAAGTPVDMTQYTKESNREVESETADVTVLADAARKHVVGMEDGGEIPLSGPLTTGIYNHLVGMKALGTPLTYTSAPLGTDSGNPKIDVECNLTKLSVASGVDDAVGFAATLKAFGTTTLGTYA